MDFRTFEPQERDLVIELYRQSFADSEGESEGEVIATLVNELFETAEDLHCYAALSESELLGAVCFTPMTFKRTTASEPDNDSVKIMLLSPMGVATEHQKQGIGQRLIRYGIEQLTAEGTDWLLTYGDPNYYRKVGFQSLDNPLDSSSLESSFLDSPPLERHKLKAPHPLNYPAGWIGQSLSGLPIENIESPLSCTAALDKAVYW